jgi:hypothetical protein
MAQREDADSPQLLVDLSSILDVGQSVLHDGAAAPPREGETERDRERERE